LKQQERENSDKENSANCLPQKVTKKKSMSTPKQEKEVRPEVFGICTGNSDTCSVHCTSSSRPKWYFYWNVDQLDELIGG